MPNVVNQTQAAAQGAGTATGLTNGTVTNANGATCAECIIAGSSLGGSSVAPGRLVAGRVARTGTSSQYRNIMNQTQAAAQGVDCGCGLADGTVTSANSAAVAAGISNGPEPGSRGTNVRAWNRGHAGPSRSVPLRSNVTVPTFSRT